MNDVITFYVGDLRYKYPLSQLKLLHRKATLILEFLYLKFIQVAFRSILKGEI